MKRIHTGKIRKNILLLSITIAVVMISFTIKSHLNNKKEKILVEKNYAILKKLENKSIDIVEKNISKNKDSGSKDIKMDSVGKKSSESNKAFFESSVFMGDSITEALQFYDILNPSSVLAEKGQSVIQARKVVSKLVGLNPKRIFLLYGANDLELFSNPSDFENNYIKLIEDIKEKLPNSQIYVESVLPMQPKAENENKLLSSVRNKQFLEVVKRVAEKEKINFVDITSLVAGKDYLYEPDGIHFTKKFYDLLLNFLREKL